MERSDDKPRHSVGALVLLVIDLLLVTLACLELGFVVPAFWEMLRDFGGPLPTATRILNSISSTIMAFHGVGFVLVTVLVLFLVMRMYLAFHRRGDRKGLFACLWATFATGLVLIGIMTFIMFLPISNIECIIGGPTTESNHTSEGIRQPANGSPKPSM
jgi:hypothetical protein